MIEELFLTRLEHYINYLKVYSVPNQAIEPERIDNLYKEIFFLLEKLKTLNEKNNQAVDNNLTYDSK